MNSPSQEDILSSPEMQSPIYVPEIKKEEGPVPIERDFIDHPIPNRTKPEGKKSALHIALKGTPTPAASQSELLPAAHEAVVMTKYTVYWFNQKDNDKLYQMIIEWPHVEIVKEAIRDVIPYFNQRLAEDNSEYTLLLDPSKYEFFKAKKSGKPKVDYPSLDADQPLSTTGIQELTLVERTSSAVILRNDVLEEDEDENTEKPNEGKGESKVTMLKSTMPGRYSVASYRSMGEVEEYVTEMFCCCIPYKRKIVKTNKSLHTKDDLRQSLLQN